MARYATLAVCALLAACDGAGEAAPTAAPVVSTSPPGTGLPTPVASAGSQATADTTEPTEAPASALTAGWRSLAPLPTARTEVAVAELGGTIYVAGGYAADGSTLDIVEAYDLAADRWTAVAPLPAGRNHMGLAAVGGRLYAVGGYAGPISASSAAADVWTYDPTTNAWVAVAPLPAPRAAHAAVTSDDRLYIVGGVGPNPRTTLVYEPAADRWSALAPIPTEREHLAAAVLDGRIYAVAGRAGGANLDVAEAYVIAGDRWEELPPLPTARSGLASAIVAGQVAVIGGEAIDGSGGTFAEVELFEPMSGRWSAVQPMPTARHGLGAVVVDGALYVIGGGPVAGLTVSGANERYVPVQ